MILPVMKKRFTLFWEEKGKMFSQKEYHDHLIECRLYHWKFKDMQQSLSGKVIVDKLSYAFELLFSFKSTCAWFPYFSYREHVELRVLEKEMASLDLPSIDQWKLVEKYGISKYKMHRWRLVKDHNFED